jgi:hypothetical protein
MILAMSEIILDFPEDTYPTAPVADKREGESEKKRLKDVNEIEQVLCHFIT